MVAAQSRVLWVHCDYGLKMQGTGKIITLPRYRFFKVLLYILLLGSVALILFTGVGDNLYTQFMSGSEVQVTIPAPASRDTNSMAAKKQHTASGPQEAGSQETEVGSQELDLLMTAFQAYMSDDINVDTTAEEPGTMLGGGSNDIDMLQTTFEDYAAGDRSFHTAGEWENMVTESSQETDMAQTDFKDLTLDDMKFLMTEEQESMIGERIQEDTMMETTFQEFTSDDVQFMAKTEGQIRGLPMATPWDGYQGDGSLDDELVAAFKELMPREKNSIITGTQPSSESFQGDGMPVNQAERKRHLQKVCNNIRPPPTPWYLGSIPRLITVDKQHPVLYCPVQKVASTLFVRILTVLGSNGMYTSPFQIGLQQKMVKNMRQLDMTNSQTDEYMANLLSFMFVRDPYSRLFSAYVDKVYMSYTDAIAIMFPGLTTPTLTSGLTTVTFAEFIKFILKMSAADLPLDKHVAPMHTLCDPCALDYDFMGKLETFQQDTEYVFDTLENKFDDFKISIIDFSKEGMLDDIKRRSASLFSILNTINTLSSKDIFRAFNRAWSHFKIRGYIDKERAIPFAERDIDSLDLTTYLNYVVGLITSQPLSSERAKLQREEAMIKAYRSVSIADLEKLRLYVLKDCQLFDYDDRPSKVFDKQTPVSEYNYFPDLKYTSLSV